MVLLAPLAALSLWEELHLLTCPNQSFIPWDRFLNASRMKKVHKQSSLTPALQLFALANQRNLGSEQIAAGRATRAAMNSSLACANYAGTACF